MQKADRIEVVAYRAQRAADRAAALARARDRASRIAAGAGAVAAGAAAAAAWAADWIARPNPAAAGAAAIDVVGAAGIALAFYGAHAIGRARAIGGRDA